VHPGIWRLLASNSRELGRSSSVYSSFVSARAHVLELRDQCDSMVVTVVTGPSAGTHGWVITVSDIVVMTAGRWYGAASASREASAGTIEAFRSAFVAADARHANDAGRRGSRVLSDEERALAW
jgi:acetyl-CoA carboxylase carboxyltransferase component